MFLCAYRLASELYARVGWYDDALWVANKECEVLTGVLNLKHDLSVHERAKVWEL